MDEPRKNRTGIAASCLVIASVVGIMLVDVVADQPKSFVPIPAAGRVCAAPHVGAPGTYHNLFYYTTSGWCDLSWSFAVVLLIACMILAANR
jgi:hypothetical protein